MNAIAFGILFGMISLVLLNVLLLQHKTNEIKERIEKEGDESVWKLLRQ